MKSTSVRNMFQTSRKPGHCSRKVCQRDAVNNKGSPAEYVGQPGTGIMVIKKLVIKPRLLPDVI